MSLHIYLPQDRLRALVNKTSLPDRTSGTALFADISGFTALTEALCKALGSRRGTEELTRRIEAVYSALITQIELFGGSVIDFAGDSMLCWFDEDLSRVANIESLDAVSQPTAAHRAVACGVALQRAMRGFVKIVLPDKSMTTLALKVAIASGTARRFVVGDPKIHVMDALAGSTIARTATAEHHAQGGEVIIDEVTADILGKDVIIHEWRKDPDECECFAVLERLTQPIDPPVLMQFDPGYLILEELYPWLHTSLVEREQAGQVSFLTEFRPCVAMFVRFSGIDFDQDTAGLQLDAFICQAQAIVTRYEGTFLQITIGDKGNYAYINFGVLSAHEDDARRAVRAAVGLRRAAHGLGFLEPLQIGLAQGPLRVGAYGGHTRKSFTAIGDEVNLAARLMTNAAPGEILLSSHVHKAVEQFFIFEPRPPLAIKGKTEPLPVFVLTGERKQRAIRLQEPNYALPMVGRERELGIINDKLDLAATGQAQVIAIVAEAGIGKSRLVAEVIRLAHKKGFVGYGGACQSDGINTPYLAWKSIWSAFFDIDPGTSLKKQMRSLENILEDYVPHRLQAKSLLNSVLDMAMPESDFTSNLEPQYRKSALTALFEDCLRAASKDELLLIVVEDVHWIDGLSHDLLEDLAKALSDCQICFVLAYRPPQLTRVQAPRLEALAQFTKIELHELTKTEAEQAIRAKLAQLYPARADAVPVQLVDKLMTRSQGNPFFLEELLNYLHDRGLNPYEPSVLEKIELPDSLHSLVLNRLDQLSEREKTTLRVASIVGRLFRASWLTGYYPALGDLTHVKVDLDKLASMDITPLASGSELAYLFKHMVIHEVIYESLPFGLRAQLHEQLARFLERQIVNGTMSEAALLDTLVFHYIRSENKAKQRLYLQKAGQAALDTSAFDSALEYFTHLLNLTPANDSTRCALALQLAEAYFRLGDYLPARAAIEQAQAAARTAGDHAAALALLGEMTSEMGEYVEAQKILSEAAPLARSSNDRLILCRALYALGDVEWRQGRLDHAKLALGESLALARELGDVTRELFALNRLGMMYWQIDLAEAERLLSQVHTQAVAAGNRERAMTALNNLGEVAKGRQDYKMAQDYQQQALALARELSVQDMIALGLINLADVDINLREFLAARAKLREALGLALRLGALHRVVLAVTVFAYLAYAEGQIERALALIGLARRQFAWSSDSQRDLDAALARWALDASVVKAGMARGAKLDWDKTIEELLKV